MWYNIILSIIFIIIAFVVTKEIVNRNRDMYGKAYPGWWMIGVGISQICIVFIFASWWKEWTATHLWIIYLSGGIAILSVILWVIVKIFTAKRH